MAQFLIVKKKGIIFFWGGGLLCSKQRFHCFTAAYFKMKAYLEKVSFSLTHFRLKSNHIVSKLSLFRVVATVLQTTLL